MNTEETNEGQYLNAEQSKRLVCIYVENWGDWEKIIVHPFVKDLKKDIAYLKRHIYGQKRKMFEKNNLGKQVRDIVLTKLANEPDTEEVTESTRRRRLEDARVTMLNEMDQSLWDCYTVNSEDVSQKGFILATKHLRNVEETERSIVKMYRRAKIEKIRFIRHIIRMRRMKSNFFLCVFVALAAKWRR